MHLLNIKMLNIKSDVTCLASLQAQLRRQLRVLQLMPLAPWMWTVQTSQQQQGLGRRQQLLLLQGFAKMEPRRWMRLMLTLQQLRLVARAAQAQPAGSAGLMAQQMAQLCRMQLRLERATLLGPRQPA